MQNSKCQQIVWTQKITYSKRSAISKGQCSVITTDDGKNEKRSEIKEELPTLSHASKQITGVTFFISSAVDLMLMCKTRTDLKVDEMATELKMRLLETLKEIFHWFVDFPQNNLHVQKGKKKKKSTFSFWDQVWQFLCTSPAQNTTLKPINKGIN